METLGCLVLVYQGVDEWRSAGMRPGALSVMGLWTTNDGNVACRQAGYSRFGLVKYECLLDEAY